MTGHGRPLRFVASVGALWISARVAILWQATGSLPVAIERALPVPRVIAAARAPVAAVPQAPVVRAVAMASRGVPLAVAPSGIAHDPVRAQLALLAMVRFGAPIVIADDAPPPVPAGGPASAPAPLALAGVIPSRWSAGAWLLMRPGSGAGASLGAAQLGGSQGGARIDYALGRTLALTGRVATPLSGVGREMALGVAWKPANVPVRLIAEQRIAIDRGRGGPSLALVGGLSGVPLGAGFRLEGYAQGGVIARRGTEGYVDGLARVAHPIDAVRPVDLDMGMGAWGGAQRGAARLDIGPSAALRVPLADRAMRVSLDWRQRVTGDTRPGSGPTLTIGSDF